MNATEISTQLSPLTQANFIAWNKFEFTDLFIRKSANYVVLKHKGLSVRQVCLLLNLLLCMWIIA